MWKLRALNVAFRAAQLVSVISHRLSWTLRCCVAFALSTTLHVALILCAFDSALLAKPAQAEAGRASWYALTSKTASGERGDPDAMTAAHRSLPFGTVILVENLENKRSVAVRVNDRGPFVGGRVIDVTRAVATRLGFVKMGSARVRVTVIAGGR